MSVFLNISNLIQASHEFHNVFLDNLLMLNCQRARTLADGNMILEQPIHAFGQWFSTGELYPTSGPPKLSPFF